VRGWLHSLGVQRSYSQQATYPVTTQSKRSFMVAIEKAHGRQLRRFLSVRMRGAAADVPDVVQEIFLRLLRIRNHEAIRNPQAYLYTVASHVLHQYTLQRSAHPASMDPLVIAAECELADVAADPADEVEVGQRLEEIGRALRQLSPRAYATLVMYRCEGLTLAEIGARLGVSHVMVRKYLARAVAYCDQHLEEMEEGRSA
jgi:RNA polymerase sigma factor (sigma-70 family)